MKFLTVGPTAPKICLSNYLMFCFFQPLGNQATKANRAALQRSTKEDVGGSEVCRTTVICEMQVIFNTAIHGIQGLREQKKGSG